MKPIVVNLTGGPGSGKSTLCAQLFYILKSKNIDVEMATEYVKDLVFEESFKNLHVWMPLTLSSFPHEV